MCPLSLNEQAAKDLNQRVKESDAEAVGTLGSCGGNSRGGGRVRARSQLGEALGSAAQGRCGQGRLSRSSDRNLVRSEPGPG